MAHQSRARTPIKDSKRRPPRYPPRGQLNEQKLRIALGLASGLNGKQAAMAAGVSEVSAPVRASEARNDPRVQEIIAEGRRAFVQTIGAAHLVVRRRLGLEPGPCEGITMKDALDYALSRHFVQVAGLLAPDTAPPPTAGALVEALLVAIPPHNLGPLMLRAARVVGEPVSEPRGES